MRDPLASDDVDEDQGAGDAGAALDPARLRVETKSLLVESLVRRLREGAIDPLPELARAHGLGSDRGGSRLIESLLVRIPLPAFFIDATDDERWLPMDGVQRLGVLQRFIVAQSLALSDLEYVPAYAGLRFSELPRAMQRRIEETPVQVHLVQPGTPPDVRANLWRRINTGGEPLSAQEIRHALFGGSAGRASAFLGKLAALPPFVEMTGDVLAPLRMADRALVLHFFAARDKAALDRAMERLNGASDAELADGEARFARAVAAFDELSSHEFGTVVPGTQPHLIMWLTQLDALDDDAIARLIARKQAVAAALPVPVEKIPDVIHKVLA